MGIRKTQLFGLRDEAEQFLEHNCEKSVSEKCPHCNKPIRFELKKDEYKNCSYLGMFDDGPTLRQYYLKDGTIIKEIVQAAPWSSGPCIFLCLEDSGGKIMFGWDDDDINGA